MPRRAVLSGSGQSWAEFWRDLWCGLLRGVRAAEFRHAVGDTEGDCYADGGGSAEAVKDIRCSCREADRLALLEARTDASGLAGKTVTGNSWRCRSGVAGRARRICDC